MSLHPETEGAQDILRAAVDLGINYFDTADLYDKGANEELVGKALKNVRDKVVIATKVGNELNPRGEGWSWNPTKAYILKAVDQSMRRLQTDHIDLYQLHGGTLSDPIDETIEAFELLKSQGKVRYYGISSIRPNVIREWVKRSHLSSVMMQYSLLDRRPEEECLDLLQRSNVSVLARGSLAQGLLLGKPARDYLGLTASSVKEGAELLKELAGKRTSTQMAIGYVLKHPAVASAVVGIRTREQLEDAVNAVEPGGLVDTLYDQLRSAVPAKLYSEHR
jgi:aryl-alcohol dehydrogenase-like predicted oxidoreductase